MTEAEIDNDLLANAYVQATYGLPGPNFHHDINLPSLALPMQASIRVPTIGEMFDLPTYECCKIPGQNIYRPPTCCRQHIIQFASSHVPPAAPAAAPAASPAASLGVAPVAPVAPVSPRTVARMAFTRLVTPHQAAAVAALNSVRAFKLETPRPTVREQAKHPEILNLYRTKRNELIDRAFEPLEAQAAETFDLNEQLFGARKRLQTINTTISSKTEDLKKLRNTLKQNRKEVADDAKELRKVRKRLEKNQLALLQTELEGKRCTIAEGKRREEELQTALKSLRQEAQKLREFEKKGSKHLNGTLGAALALVDEVGPPPFPPFLALAPLAIAIFVRFAQSVVSSLLG